MKISLNEIKQLIQEAIQEAAKENIPAWKLYRQSFFHPDVQAAWKFRRQHRGLTATTDLANFFVPQDKRTGVNSRYGLSSYSNTDKLVGSLTTILRKIDRLPPYIGMDEKARFISLKTASYILRGERWADSKTEEKDIVVLANFIKNQNVLYSASLEAIKRGLRAVWQQDV